ncbi:hypothetical protein NDU88_001164 [Pleurodeles waltl]|uniref:Uncharacterized protein n=1 Tax=Pleurodeles waltl TaxID=8319 RepID=A0AAV7L8X2_PLEWA|nr:hypothetical protein NDU88_001164 [Pleurodeles waltl]
MPDRCLRGATTGAHGPDAEPARGPFGGSDRQVVGVLGLNERRLPFVCFTHLGCLAVTGAPQGVKAELPPDVQNAATTSEQAFVHLL